MWHENATVFFEGVAFFASKETRSVGGVSGDLSSGSDVVYFVNLCLCLMFVFENKFSANISQTQQSSIKHPPLGLLSTAATVRVLSL